MSTAYRNQPRAQQRQGLAITSLVLGILGLPTLGLLVIGALVALTLGIVALVKAGRYPEEYGGKGFAIGGIVTSALSLVVAVPLAGIFAAIAIPSLLRARVSANEAAAIGDIRTVISAEAAYQSANGGLYYDKLECLGAPAGCIPNYPATGPYFLDPTLVSGGVKQGYNRRFHPGAPAAPTDGTSPSSLQAYAYVAVPAVPDQSGVRAFCGESSGVICSTADGQMPDPVNGACPPTCQPLY